MPRKLRYNAISNLEIVTFADRNISKRCGQNTAYGEKSSDCEEVSFSPEPSIIPIQSGLLGFGIFITKVAAMRGMMISVRPFSNLIGSLKECDQGVALIKL